MSDNHLSEQELIQGQKNAKAQVEVGAKYFHYRNPSRQYEVVGLGVLEATQEPCVFYKALTGPAQCKS